MSRHDDPMYGQQKVPSAVTPPRPATPPPSSPPSGGRRAARSQTPRARRQPGPGPAVRRFDGEMPPEPPTPLWFKIWFAVYAAFGLTMAGLFVWLIVEVVAWLRRN